MNYIKQLNAFHDCLEQNTLSTSAFALYFALLMANNKCGWTEWFPRTNLALCAIASISENTLKRARNELKQKGLIEFKPGTKKNNVTKYKIIPLYSDFDIQPDTKKHSVSNFDTQLDTQNYSVSNFDTQSDTQPDTQLDTQSDTQPDTKGPSNTDISRPPEKLNYKHKLKHKYNNLLNINDDVVINNSNSVSNSDTQVDTQNETNPLIFYQQNIGPLLPSIVDLVNEYRKELPDELITEAFKIAVKNNVRSMRYAEKIMLTWLDKGIRTMEDYKRHEAEWEHRKAAEAGREEAPAKRQYTQAEIEAAARYIKRAISRYEGNDVLGFIYSLGYPQEVADGAVKLLRERKELVV